MGFLDDIAAAANPVQFCKMGRWLAEQDPKYRVEIEDALRSEYGTNTIWRVLTNKHGQVMSASVFAKHRERRCCCGLEG
jgi:hypothetical protein